MPAEDGEKLDTVNDDLEVGNDLGSSFHTHMQGDMLRLSFGKRRIIRTLGKNPAA